ncbi:MAG: AtpZ/AtpI family protein [Clostridiales bacterium]|jgi:F0F1-type ATP synthase assembly protein I|nr:AtpZ/AtpI family protein [Clostridiales bacterium]
MFNSEDMSGMGVAINLALTISLPLIGGVLLGQYLGRRFGNEPLFILVCVILGLLVGFRQAIRMLLKK